MKVLFISSKRFDYSQDLAFSGLTKILGNNNVRTINWNIKHYLPTKKYPKNLGYNGLNIPRPLFSMRNIDLVIVAAAKPDCFETYLNILPKIPANIPIAFIDGGDLPEIAGDLNRYKCYHLYEKTVSIRPFNVIFKREMILESNYSNNVYPFPFAINFNKYKNIQSVGFKYDVSFWAVESHPIRTQALDLLENKFDCHENGTVRNQVFSKYKRKGKFYFEELTACKIVLNFRGNGWDTLRYWEVPALGRFMISQEPKIHIPNNFRNHESIVFCNDDLSNLEDLCHYYLKQDNEREKIANGALVHANQYHSDIVRAREILTTSVK